jgi:putative transposase
MNRTAAVGRYGRVIPEAPGAGVVGSRHQFHCLKAPSLPEMRMKGAFLPQDSYGGSLPLFCARKEEKDMKKAYRYRIYPTKKQARLLHEQLALCAELYNAALQERRDAWRMCGKSITFTQQRAQLPQIKQIRPEYEGIYSQVLHRVDKAFQAFFRRVKAGQTPGYPRFKSRCRYGSLTYPQFGFGLDKQGKLSIAKIGHLKLVMHRPFKGVVKTATITRAATGKWNVSFSCDEVEPDVLPPSERQVGIDVGLSTFAYLSTGEHIENPRFFREEEHALARAQRRLFKAQGDTKERAKRRRVVARVHERIGWRRENFVQQESRKLVNHFGLIAVETLVVRNMVKNPRLAKSISDAAWSSFFTYLFSKAEEAARTVVRVQPAYTSQTCSGCGHLQEILLSVRIYECPHCGLVMDRDHNASVNILQQAVGRHGCVIPEAPGAGAVGSRHFWASAST